MTRDTLDMLTRLHDAGISNDDALALRRIAITLHRWFELECGIDNGFYSACLVRGHRKNGSFEYDDNGKPFAETHYHRGDATTHYVPVPDRETGARKRLAKIMAKYPRLRSYIQTDPRGASLYILRKADWNNSNGYPVDQCYNYGIAVYK